MAFVVTRSGTPPAGAEILAWCRDEMANYKVPRAIEIVDALPGERHRQGGQGRAAGQGRRRGLTSRALTYEG